MKYLTLIIVLSTSISTFSQDVELAKNQLNVNVIPLTLAYEAKLAKNMSLAVSGGITPSIVLRTAETSGVSETNTYFFLSPYMTSSLRGYYPRKNVKKDNLRSNSGNYLGIFYSHQFKPFGGEGTDFDEIKARRNTTNVSILGPVWGIQRNYASGIHLGLSIGMGVTWGENIELSSNFSGEFQLGYVLFSKK